MGNLYQVHKFNKNNYLRYIQLKLINLFKKRLTEVENGTSLPEKLNTYLGFGARDLHIFFSSRTHFKKSENQVWARCFISSCFKRDLISKFKF